jgi:hypothetical protein
MSEAVLLGNVHNGESPETLKTLEVRINFQLVQEKQIFFQDF